MSISELREFLDKSKIKRETIEQDILYYKDQIEALEKDIDAIDYAQAIIQKVAKETQRGLEYHISELCSLALSAIFDNPYELKIEFTERRGRTEADIYFERDGIKYNKPLQSIGGGAIDVACFGLRVAIWSLSHPKTRNVMILDEPFQHLKGDEANRRAIEMVKEISDHIGLQIIMISDERVKQEAIVEGADRVFQVKKKNKISKVDIL